MKGTEVDRPPHADKNSPRGDGSKRNRGFLASPQPSSNGNSVTIARF